MDRSEFKRIIEFAINNEMEAYAFYRDVSERMQDPHLKGMFMGFAEEEKRHKEVLEGFLSMGPEDLHFPETTDYKLSETVDKPTLSTEMHPADAIALAMKNEEEAMKFYTDLADSSKDPSMQRIFHELAAMEGSHKQKMENAFNDITFPSDWSM